MRLALLSLFYFLSPLSLCAQTQIPFSLTNPATTTIIGNCGQSKPSTAHPCIPNFNQVAHSVNYTWANTGANCTLLLDGSNDNINWATLAASHSNVGTNFSKSVTLTASGPLGVQFDHASSSGGVSPLTWTHAGAVTLTNGLIVVGISYPDTTTTTTSVTYNGVALTQFSRNTDTNVASEIWYLAAPATGSHAVVVTSDNPGGNLVAGAITFTAANQVTPLTNAATDSGNNAGPATVTITAAYGDRTFAVAAADQTLTASAGTSEWALSAPNNGAGSISSGTSIIAWTLGASGNWVVSGADIQAAAITWTASLTAPVAAGSVTVTTNLPSGVSSATDDGAGHITGAHITAGSVNYATGALSITYDQVPYSSPVATYQTLALATYRGIAYANGYYTYLRIKVSACTGTLTGIYTGYPQPIPINPVADLVQTSLLAGPTQITGYGTPFLVMGLQCTNPSASPGYLQLFKSNTTPTLGTSYFYQIELPANGVPISYTGPAFNINDVCCATGAAPLWAGVATSAGGSTATSTLVPCTFETNGSGPFYPATPLSP